MVKPRPGQRVGEPKIGFGGGSLIPGHLLLPPSITNPSTVPVVPLFLSSEIAARFRRQVKVQLVSCPPWSESLMSESQESGGGPAVRGSLPKKVNREHFVRQ